MAINSEEIGINSEEIAINSEETPISSEEIFAVFHRKKPFFGGIFTPFFMHFLQKIVFSNLLYINGNKLGKTPKKWQ